MPLAGGVAGAGRAIGAGVAIGAGAVPVVKSYPQTSQNRASEEAGAPQCGHVVAVAADGAAGAGASTTTAASIGEPQTSQ